MPVGCVARIGVRSLRHGADHIVRRQRSPDPLQRELTHRLDLHGVLDLRQHSRADEDLPRLGFIAQPRGDIGYRPDGGIIEAPLEADGAERGKAVRYADAEANVVSPPTPRFGQRSDSVAHFERHEHGLERRVLYRHWVVEDDHHAVASVTLKCSAILDDARSDCLMVLTQDRHHIFGVRTFGEASEAAQVTEERGYLAAMALQLLLAPRRDDQISHLRRQEAPQPAHALDFAHLVGDALFELLVELASTSSVLSRSSSEQPRVLDGDDGLGGEVLHQFDLLVCEGTNFLAIDGE